MKSPFKIFWIVLGFLCLGFGTIGIVVSVLFSGVSYDCPNGHF